LAAMAELSIGKILLSAISREISNQKKKSCIRENLRQKAGVSVKASYVLTANRFVCVCLQAPGEGRERAIPLLGSIATGLWFSMSEASGYQIVALLTGPWSG
jgi:hypothetical protein